MNFLHDIFLETFAHRHYFSNSWRAYVEYVGTPQEKFSWQICFFHFSHANINLNSFHDFEIVKFIQLFYAWAYDTLLPLMKYAIEKKFVMSMNSLDEYTFVIKFWNEDTYIRDLFTKLVQQHSKSHFSLEEDDDIRFFEMKISLQDSFFIEEIIVYSEKDLRKNIEYRDQYIDEDNVFMTLEMKKYHIKDFFTHPRIWMLIKLNLPICFSDSEYIMNHIYPSMEIPFSADSLYVWFIEQGFSQNSIYYTHWYSIPA